MGTCVNTNGSFHCDCPEGWKGLQCEHDIDECQVMKTCSNEGTCVNKNGSFHCECSEGWQGKLCEHDIDECLINDSCRNEGNCVNTNGSYHCECAEGWQGPLCEQDFDECKVKDTCHGSATCLNNEGSFKCICNEQWTGIQLLFQLVLIARGMQTKSFKMNPKFETQRIHERDMPFVFLKMCLCLLFVYGLLLTNNRSILINEKKRLAASHYTCTYVRIFTK